MRDEMGTIDNEQSELETRVRELERQLSRRILSGKREENIKKIAEKINKGIDNLDFKGRQRLLRLLVEKVIYDGQKIEIQTIIPLNEQLCPVHRGGLRG